MTVSTTSNKVICQGNGLTNSFPFSFPVPAASDLKVYYTDQFGNTTTLASSVYTVSGVGSQNGGSVTYPISGSPISTGTTLTIQRIVPNQQLTDLVNQSGYYPDVVEGALDNLEMQIQQVAQAIANALVFPIFETPSNTVLPVLGSRLNKLLGFDSSGAPTAITMPASVGAGNLTSEGPFVSGTNFTPGVTTALTLSQAYSNPANVQVHFDGVYQGPDQYTLSGNQIIFTSPIPNGTNKVYVIGGTTLSIFTPAANSVGDAQIASNSIVYARSHNNTVWVTDPAYGAVGDGVTVNTAAFQAAINYLNSIGGGELYIPPGKYSLGPLTLYPNITVRGAGPAATKLLPTSSGALFTQTNAAITPALNVTSSAVTDLAIDAGTVTGVTGVKWVLCSNTRVENVKFIGCLTTVYADRGRTHMLLNSVSTGSTVQANAAAGYTFLSSVDTDYIFNVKVRGFSMVNIGNGTQSTFAYIRRAVAYVGSQLDVNDMNAGNGSPGIFHIFENDCQGCKVTDSIVGGVGAGFSYQVGSGVNTAPSFIEIDNVDIDQAYTAHHLVNNCNWLSIRGGMLTSSGQGTGVAAVTLNLASQVLVDGVQFNGFNGATGAAIAIGNVTDARITNNKATNCTQGINVAGTLAGVVTVENNDMVVAGPITGVINQASLRCRNNPGINPPTAGQIGGTSPSMPASTVSKTNTTGFDCRVFINGGTFTTVTINGIATGAFNNNWSGTLKVGETIAITYSSAPTWWWIGL